MLPEDQQLLTDKQLRDASEEQVQDLIARVDLLLRSKGQPGLTLHPPKMSPTRQSLPIPPIRALSSFWERKFLQALPPISLFTQVPRRGLLGSCGRPYISSY